MSKVLPLTPTAKQLLASHEAQAPRWQRDKAAKRLAQLRPLLEALAHGEPKCKAVAAWSKRTGVSTATAMRWLSAYRRSGFDGLMPRYRGRQANLHGLEGVILQLYNQPQRPNCGTIALWIREERGIELTAAQIRRFIKKLPAVAAEQSPRRMGRHTYDLTVRPYTERDATQFAFGEAVVSDGHCMKIVIRHPETDKLSRFEFTPIIDIRSNFMFSFWLSEAESADTTVFALCSMMAEWDHAPTIFYTDPGPGFKNKRVHALLDRVGTTPIIARGGNARGKGFGEGMFHLFTEREAKKYAACCSHDRTDDLMARTETKWKKGEVYIPTFEEVLAHLQAFRDRYNRRPQPYSKRLQGKAPIDLMEGWQPSGIAVESHELIRPQAERSVRGSAVRIHNRRYVSSDLLAYEKRRVLVETDTFDLSHVFVWSKDGRFVGQADCAEAQPYVPESFLAAARRKSDDRKLKLLDQHKAEVEARSRRILTPAAFVEAVEGEEATPPDSLEQRSARELIAQGQHVTLPEHPRARPRAAKPVNREMLERMTAEDAPVQETETAEERFARAMRLEARLEAGETLAERDASWFEIYQESAEYHARCLLAEEARDAEESSTGPCRRRQLDGEGPFYSHDDWE